MKHFTLIVFLFLSFTMQSQQSDFSHINFNKADSIAKVYEGESLNNLPLLAYKLTHHLNTQVEEFRAIHTWVCSNIESDHSFGEKTLRKRRKYKTDSIAFYDWNTEVQAKVFKRLLKDKKTICSGYAYLLKELSALVDIKCEIVDGYSRTVNTNIDEVDFPNHSWNVVQLNNKWYLVDATLASGFFYVNENIFIKNYNDGYFLAKPELFVKNHYPLDEKWILLETKPTLNQFVKAPIIYSKIFKHDVIPIAPQSLQTNVLIGDYVVFKFKISDKTNIDDISLFISSSLKYDKIKPTRLNYKNGFIVVKYRFVKKGNYDVQLLVNKDVVVSYVVKVLKHKIAL